MHFRERGLFWERFDYASISSGEIERLSVAFRYVGRIKIVDSADVKIKFGISKKPRRLETEFPVQA